MLRPTIADLIADSEKLRREARKVREQSQTVVPSSKETVDQSRELAERLIQKERLKKIVLTPC